MFIMTVLIDAVPVVRETWASDAGQSIAYYSDSEDAAFNTINIGVPNTERGLISQLKL